MSSIAAKDATVDGARVLIVDDEPQMLENLDRLLSSEGLACRTLSNPDAFAGTFSDFEPDVLIMDLRMPGSDGLELMTQAHETDPTLPVILITGHATVQSAVEAIQQGAFDYLAKPFTADQLSVAVERALRFRGLVRENQSLRARVSEDPFAEVVAASPVMSTILDLVRKVAASDATVLVTGESGTGKELIARLLHRASPRSMGPFVPVDCAALPEGLLESELYGHERGAFTGAVAAKRGLLLEAQQGTLFLDEIGEMTAPLQSKLLRVLEERQVRSVGGTGLTDVDFRLVAATNVDLEQAVRSGAFREDLFYRLNVVHVCLPPLRERREDVVLLADRFLMRGTRPGVQPLRVTAGALARLEDHDWPGNIRELRNVVERAVALDEDGQLGVDDLPSELGRARRSRGVANGSVSTLADLPYDEAREQALARFLDEYVQENLARSGGNVTRAAQAAGVSRRTFHRWLADLGAQDESADADES